MNDKCKNPLKPHKNLLPIVYAVSYVMRMPKNIAEDAQTLIDGSLTLRLLKMDRKLLGEWVRKNGPLWIYTKELVFDEDEYKKMLSNI